MRAMIFRRRSHATFPPRRHGRAKSTTFSRIAKINGSGRQSGARAGSEYDNRAFPAPHGTILSTAGRGRIRRDLPKRAIAGIRRGWTELGPFTPSNRTWDRSREARRSTRAGSRLSRYRSMRGGDCRLSSARRRRGRVPPCHGVETHGPSVNNGITTTPWLRC